MPCISDVSLKLVNKTMRLGVRAAIKTLFGDRRIDSSAEHLKEYKLAFLASKLIIHSRSSEFLGSIKQIRDTFKRMPPDVVLIFKATESDSGVSLDDT
jgi:hypothetical protein